MVNYQDGKIYKIVDNTNNNVYIGSTCEPTLARRLAKHVGHYKFWKNGKTKSQIGLYYCKVNKPRHLRSKKHISLMTSDHVTS